MSNPAYFVQGCPTCGRRLEIRVEYLGRKVVCQHCQGSLVAVDPASARDDYVDQSVALLRRADELLDPAVLDSAIQRAPRPHHSVR